LLGHEVIKRWNEWIQAGETPKVVTELLALHYDPAYTRSIARNFTQFKNAQIVEINHFDTSAFERLAKALHA
jgi:tRNA 2-selenouridine synthase